MNIQVFRQLPIQEQQDLLEAISRRLLRDDEFLIILEAIRESVLQVDESLKGTEMREEIYRKACMRDGLDAVPRTLEILAQDKE